MSRLEELEANFYEKYERAMIEPYILGFSGIDPPLKRDGSDSPTDHENMYRLLGGNSAGHYHLTREEYEKILELLEDYAPLIYGGQEIEAVSTIAITPYEVQGENLR